MQNRKSTGIAVLLCTFLLLTATSFADNEVAMKGPLIDQHMETTLSNPTALQWEPVNDVTPSSSQADTTGDNDDTSQTISSTTTTDESAHDSEVLPAVSRLYYPSLFDE